jgi:PleD family two-component response regulator
MQAIRGPHGCVQEAVKAAVKARYAAVQGMLQEAAAAAGAARARSRKEGQAAEGQARMVLVVDSEKKFRSKLRTLLRAGGQHALFARDAFEALDIYDANPAAIACILTELKPSEDMTGWQVQSAPCSRLLPTREGTCSRH